MDEQHERTAQRLGTLEEKLDQVIHALVPAGPDRGRDPHRSSSADHQRRSSWSDLPTPGPASIVNAVLAPPPVLARALPDPDRGIVDFSC
eukprot:3255295-Rhodomonas_salina.1